MADLTVDGVVDLMNSKFREYGEPKFHQIATRLPRYEVMGRILRNDKRMYGGPHGISENIMTDHGAVATEDALHKPREYKTEDFMAEMNVPWRHLTTYFVLEHREILMNASPKRIFNLKMVREASGLISLAELAERRFWGKPVDSNDKLRLFGIFYWLCYNATKGLNGGNVTGFDAGRGGINSTQKTRWKNQAGNYVKISKKDGIATLRDLCDDANFESPVDIADFRKGRGDQFRWYGGRPTIREFENVGEDQNENLGRDVASMDGRITFRRNAIVRVPQLDSMASAPFIGLNWDWIRLGVLRGNYMRRLKARTLDKQPNTIIQDIDLTLQLAFLDLRSQILIAKSDPVSDLT